MNWIYPAQPSFTRVMTKINNNQQFVGFLGVDRPVSKIGISEKKPQYVPIPDTAAHYVACLPILSTINLFQTAISLKQ